MPSPETLSLWLELGSAGILFWIMKVDFLEKKISLIAVILLGGLSLLNLFFLSGDEQIERGLSALILGGVFLCLSKVLKYALGRPALGKGDVKLAFPLGLWIPLNWLPFYLILTGILGILGGIFCYSLRKEREFPFAPSMILSLWGLKFFMLL